MKKKKKKKKKKRKKEEEGGRRRIRPEKTKIEDGIESYLNDYFEGIKGEVNKEAKIKDLEDVTTQINTIMELKGSEGLNKILNPKAESYFKESVLPILENLDISENALITKLLGKKSSKSLTYSNLEKLKKVIMRFQNKYRIESQKSDVDIKQEK